MSTGRRAYTLFEVMLVLAILVILAALSYPSLELMYGDYKVTAAADAVRAAWAQARSEAMDKGVPYRVAIVPNGGNYRIAPDTAEYWSGGESPPPEDPANPPTVLDDVLPAGIVFATLETLNTGAQAAGSFPAGAVDPGAWVTQITFLPNGAASDDVEVVFQARGARPLLLRMRAMTGVVTARQFRPGELQP